MPGKVASEPVVRIAMWSGPRNISTAMMRAFENRADCVVSDEPFYACYLAASGLEHPMREQVLASQATDWSAVTTQLQQPLGAECSLHYQKHMAQHMLVPPDPAWLQSLRHAFLIRDPQDMVASYVRKRGSVTVDDLGLPRQVSLYQQVCSLTEQSPPILDAKHVLADPEPALRSLCRDLRIKFSDRMLSWPPGIRSSDGIWASHWYNAVAESTGFGRYSEHRQALPKAYRRVVEECRPHYEYLRERKSN